MTTTAPLWLAQSGLAIRRSVCFTWSSRGSPDQVGMFPVCPRAMCGQWGTGPAPAIPLRWRCSRLGFLSRRRRPTFLCVHSRKARRLNFSPSDRNTAVWWDGSGISGIAPTTAARLLSFFPWIVIYLFLNNSFLCLFSFFFFFLYNKGQTYQAFLLVQCLHLTFLKRIKGRN